MPKVSVIVPVYNVEKYLKRGLDCLINQTLRDIEIILINDGSTDNSLEILKEYASKDDRIKLINLETNQGAAVARNRGLDVATGEYLGFVDPDDTIDLNYYEELYKKAKLKDYDIAKAQLKTFNRNDIKISGLNEVIKARGLYAFVAEWTTAIYKASVIFNNNIRFRDDIKKAQDILFLNNFILKANSIVLVDNVFYNYYRREDSLDADILPLDKITSAMRSYSLILDNLNNADLSKDDYMYIYNERMGQALRYILFKNPSYEAKFECVKNYIDFYYKCKEINLLENCIKGDYPWILPYVKAKDVKKLTKKLMRIKTPKDLYQKQYSFIQRLFSITNDRSRNKKIVMIMGLKISFKYNKGE